MKYVIAIIQPNRFYAVLKALEENAIHLVTVGRVTGKGREVDQLDIYRDREADGLIKKIKVEIAVNDSFLPATVEAIQQSAFSGEIGDGKIFILDLDEVIRIRTGETGSVAIG